MNRKQGERKLMPCYVLHEQEREKTKKKITTEMVRFREGNALRTIVKHNLTVTTTAESR